MLKIKEIQNSIWKISNGLAECVLKNNIFKHNLSFFKQLRRSAIRTKMATTYAIIFMGSLEEWILQDCGFKSLVWWRYIDDIFLLCQHYKEKLKQFLDIQNRYYGKFQPNGLNEREVAFWTQFYVTYPYSYCFQISPQHLHQFNGANTLLSYFSRIFFS